MKPTFFRRCLIRWHMWRRRCEIVNSKGPDWDEANIIGALVLNRYMERLLLSGELS